MFDKVNAFMEPIVQPFASFLLETFAIQFHWPWAFYCLPLPILVYLLVPAYKRQQASLIVPDVSLWKKEQESSLLQQENPKLKLLLPAIIWLAIVIAFSRPFSLGEQIELPQSGRDLMLAVDLSGSMKEEDMQWNRKPVNRLVVVKKVLTDFIKQREGDRIGLVLFGSQAYLQSPLTFDWQTVNQLMLESQIGLAGPATAIGDAIGLTIKRLLAHPEQSRVMILLTDGQNTAGEVDPIKAAELAAQNNVKIYTIGLGADMIEERTFFFRRQRNPSADLDETTLKKIAELTGGQYFRAKDSDGLKQIYQYIDEQEPTEKDPEIFRPQKSLFHWPLGLALVISFIQAFASLGLFAWLQQTSFFQILFKKREGGHQ